MEAKLTSVFLPYNKPVYHIAEPVHATDRCITESFKF
jgi:hypothetical protein